MAFSQPIPRPFTAQAIRFYAPATSGVYGITNSLGWIHIGDAPRIQEALLAHLDHPGQLRDLNPTGFVFEECDATQRQVRCQRLIAEYNPACGRPDTSVHNGARTKKRKSHR